jgi:catechol 2,3-dioxygenase-like lactoylglutathione lyase family enzyme
VPYRLHHIQLAIPPGGESAGRTFYVGVLGMEEIPKPATLAARGGLWLRLAGAELHLGVEAEFRPARKAHPAFEVDDLGALRDRLRGHGVPVRDDQLLPGRKRFYADDPFGNRLEFVDGEDA